MFTDESYHVARRMVEPAVCRLIHLYTLSKHALGQMRAGDVRVHGAPNLYGDALTEALLVDLLPECQRQTGLALTPSFSYLRMHFNGAELPEHTDRPGAEVVASIAIAGDHDWPLWIRIAGRPLPVNLAAGDALFLRGGQIPHWRDRYPGQRHVQMLLCYVSQAGTSDRCGEHPLLRVLAETVDTPGRSALC